MHVVAMTQALGRAASPPKGAQPEVYRWTDGTRSHVTCEFRQGKLVKWTLDRPEAEADTPPEAHDSPALNRAGLLHCTLGRRLNEQAAGP